MSPCSAVSAKVNHVRRKASNAEASNADLFLTVQAMPLKLLALLHCPVRKVQKSFTQHMFNSNLHVSHLPIYSSHGLCVDWSPFLLHCGLHANVTSLLIMLVTFEPSFYRFIGCSPFLQGPAQWQWWARRYESPTSAAAAGQQSNAGRL